MPMTDFSPRRHGFHFVNAFTNPVITIPGVGTLNTYGLCGGMSFASLDYYHAPRPVPTHVGADFGTAAGVPPVGGRLYQYLYDRQLASFNPLVNLNAAKFITMLLPVGRSAFEATVQDEWPLVMQAIDAGTPVPIGLLANSVDPTQSHQVVAIGYDNGDVQRIYIYDCNYPDTTQTLDLDATASVVTESSGTTWAGFFVDQYTPASPAYTDVALSSGIDTNPLAPVTAALQDLVEVGFRVQNQGDYVAHLTSLDASCRGPAGQDLDSAFAPDGVAKSLAPGDESAYLASATAFGPGPGTYEFIAYYQSAQGEWYAAPAGTAGTKGTTTLDLA